MAEHLFPVWVPSDGNCGGDQGGEREMRIFTADDAYQMGYEEPCVLLVHRARMPLSDVKALLAEMERLAKAEPVVTDAPKADMVRRVVPAGTVLHIGALPFRAAEEVVLEGHPGNFEMAFKG